jgi:predicted helicase
MRFRPIELLAAELAAERDAALADATEQRRAAGIVHTPASLARAVVRVGDELVREQLGLEQGLCDPSLLLIDPACGPGAFLAAALALAE